MTSKKTRKICFATPRHRKLTSLKKTKNINTTHSKSLLKTPKTKIEEYHLYNTPTEHIQINTTTPLKPSKNNSVSYTHLSSQNNKNNTNSLYTPKYNNIISKLNLIQQQKVEVEQQLTSAITIQDDKLQKLIFSKMLGLEINKNGKLYKCAFNVNHKDELRKIVFELTECDDSYCYVFNESKNIDLPEYFKDEIEFEKTQIFIFFHKIMDLIICKK